MTAFLRPYSTGRTLKATRHVSVTLAAALVVCLVAPAPAHAVDRYAAQTLFSEAKRDKVKAENPDAKITEISRILGEKWKGVSEERRANYEARAKEAKEEYEKKKAALEAKKGASSKPPPAKKQKKEVKEKKKAGGDKPDKAKMIKIANKDKKR